MTECQTNYSTAPTLPRESAPPQHSCLISSKKCRTTLSWDKLLKENKYFRYHIMHIVFHNIIFFNCIHIIYIYIYIYIIMRVLIPNITLVKLRKILGPHLHSSIMNTTLANCVSAFYYQCYVCIPLSMPCLQNQCHVCVSMKWLTYIYWNRE